MIEAVLVVLSKALAGRDDDFNDWYTHIHLRDALRFRGSIAAQRFRRSDLQIHALPENFDWQYLALYDVYDAARFSREHWENANTPRMMITDAFDASVLEDYHYYPVIFRDKTPGMPHGGSVILERFNGTGADAAEVECHYAEQVFPAAMARPGVRSGAFMAFRPHGQLMPTPASHGFVAVYRIDSAEAVDAWRDGAAFDRAIIDPASLVISHWEPITGRITEDNVLHSSAEALAGEDRARAHMGDRIHRGGQEKLATPGR